SENLHEKDSADERDRDGDDWREYRTPRSEEQKDYEHHDAECLDQSLEDFVHRIVDVSGSVVGDARLYTGRQFAFDLLQLGPSAFDHVNLVCIRQHPDAHEDSALLRIAHFGVVILGPEHNDGDVAKPYELSIL